MDDVLEPPRARGRFPAANVALFLATLATTLWAGFTFSPLYEGAHTLANVLRGGLPFAGSLIAILFTHEMGHWVLARRYRVKTSLPYFIPLPWVGFGTLGAVIRMRSAIPSRRAVMDIGAAGPLAGLAVAVPLYLLGLALSEVKPIGDAAASSALASPYAVVRALVEGRPLVDGAPTLQFFGDSLLTWGARWLVVGRLEAGADVVLHPVAFAAWLGLLVTALNLVPLGQLDGGHVIYAMFGHRGALAVARVVSAGLLLAGLFLSWSWLVWWFLSRFVVGLRHPPALVEEPLGRGRRAVGWLSLALFLATFVPVPVSV
jgi:membrane-associated protease RseP (regulator of RpoE activity)